MSMAITRYEYFPRTMCCTELTPIIATQLYILYTLNTDVINAQQLMKECSVPCLEFTSGRMKYVSRVTLVSPVWQSVAIGNHTVTNDDATVTVELSRRVCSVEKISPLCLPIA